MKKYILSTLAVFILTLESGYSTNRIEISLLTCSSGSESFTAWGHSALRIIDKERSVDVVYNFGLFDFNTPNFYLKFVQGQLKYKLGIEYTDRFVRSYSKEGRWIKEQKLDLSDSVEIEMIQRLEFLYRPENRYYFYSFLKKNCTTELRDLIFESVNPDYENYPVDKTHRDLVGGSLKDKPWLKLGINLVFGPAVDKNIDSFESMFLPDYLYNELKNVKVNNRNIVSVENMLSDSTMQESKYPFLFRPIIVFLLLFVLVVIARSNKIMVTFYFIVGITGVSMLIVWLLTEHPELKNNFNLLWCNPLYILSAVILLLKKHKLQFILSIILMVSIIILFVLWILRVQDYQLEFFPVVFALLLYNLRQLKKNWPDNLKLNNEILS